MWYVLKLFISVIYSGSSEKKTLSKVELSFFNLKMSIDLNKAPRLHMGVFLKRLHEQLKNATKDLEDIEARVKDKVALETNRLNSCDPQVKLWQSRVAHLINEEKAIELEYNKLYRRACLCSYTPNLRRRHRLAKRIASRAKAVDMLIEEEKQFKVYGRRRPLDIIEERPKTRTFVLEPVLKRLIEYFDDVERSIIGIWGQAGIGKTTLLNEFSNELEKRSGEFNVVIAIDVSNSEKLNVADIQGTITERLGLPWNEEEREETRASFLLKALEERKKFVILLLLDQVWERFRLEEIGIPAPDEKNKCKLILAVPEGVHRHGRPELDRSSAVG